MKKPCSPYGYHDMRVISVRCIKHSEDSAIESLGRLYVSWDEIIRYERCASCGFKRTTITRVNYHQRLTPPPI